MRREPRHFHNTVRAAASALALTLIASVLVARPFEQQSSVQGKLVIENGKPLIADAGGKRIRFQTDDQAIAETLSDARLSGKELKLVGHSGPDGSFQVDDFYVVRGGTLFKLIYFCDTCHITTFRPGLCECCQQPTVPMEVPLTDPRVHHEDVKRIPR